MTLTMQATPAPSKRDRLKAIIRNRLDRSINPAPNFQAATQSTSHSSRPQEGQISNSQHQGATPNSTATLFDSTNANHDNDRSASTRSLAQDSLWEDALSKLEKSSSMEERGFACDLREFAKTQDNNTTRQDGSEASNGNDLIEMVKHATDTKRAEAEQKAWTVELGARTIVLRDVATRIIDCLNKFKEIGDIAASYDPVHAALPWAAFRFLLQAVTLTKEQTGQLLAGMDVVTEAYLRARIYQDLYLGLPDRQNVADALKKNVVGLLAAICAFLGLAVKYISSGSVLNATQGLLDPESVSRCIKNIMEKEAQVEKNAQSCKIILDAAAHERQGTRYDTLTGILEAHTVHFGSIQRGLTKVDAGVSQLVEALSNEDLDRIFSWISSVPYKSDLYNAKKGRLKGTCEWLIAHETYKRWKASKVSTTLWLHGIPGAGKTKLSTKVVDDFAPMDLPPAYFFCDRNQENRRDPLAVLHSITRQLSRTSGPERINRLAVDAYNRKKEDNFASGKLTDEESRDLLLDLVNGNPRSTIIIDGLDECNEGSRKYILNTLDHLIQHSTSVVKVFVASRNDRDLTQHYNSSPNLEIGAAHNQGDIEKLVMDKISQSEWAVKEMSKHVKDEVVQLFRHKSQGMFQWASLHIDDLLSFESDQSILDWLHSLPEGLKPAYDRIYDGLDVKWHIYADRAFMWLMAAHDKQISPELLCILVHQDTSKEFNYTAKLSLHSLFSACRNLIKVDELPKPNIWDVCELLHMKKERSYKSEPTQDEHKSLVYDRDAEEKEASEASEARKACKFAHLSVQEYLETHRLILAKAERMILEISIKFWQSMSATDDSKERNEKDFNARHMSTERQLQLLTARIIEDFVSSADMSRENQTIWNQLLKSTKGQDVVDGSPAWKALVEHTMIATRFGDIGSFITPIGVCAWFDNLVPIKYWIQNGQFNTTVHEKTARDLVFRAYRRQRLAVCNLLLDEGTSFKGESSQILEGRLRDLFLDSSAVKKQQSHSTFIRLLKQLYDDGAPLNYCPNGEEVYTGTYPLEAVHILLSRGVNINAIDEDDDIKCKPPGWSRRSHNTFKWKVTPLMYSVSCGDSNIEMTKLLLEHGAKVDAMDGHEQTPLHWATRPRLSRRLTHAAQTKKISQTIRLLLDCGADPNAGTTESGTPLQILVSNPFPHVEDVKMLLDHGAQVNTVSTRYGTAIHAAALQGASRERDIYNLLLAHGADPDTKCPVSASHSWSWVELPVNQIFRSSSTTQGETASDMDYTSVSSFRKSGFALVPPIIRSFKNPPGWGGREHQVL